MTDESSVERVKQLPLIPYSLYHIVFAAGVLLGALSPEFGAAVAATAFVGSVIVRIAFVEFTRRVATNAE